jgi:hypothetical protein
LNAISYQAKNSYIRNTNNLKSKFMKKNLLLLAAMILLFIVTGYSQASFSTGTMTVTVGQYGKIQLFTPDGLEQLHRAMILVGTSPTTVFDHENDAEVVDATTLVSGPTSSDFEIYAADDNSYSNAPPAVLAKLNAHGWTNAAYTVVRYNITNNEATAINATIGYEIFPRINKVYGLDTVTYNNAEGVIRFHRGLVTNMGIKLLSASLTSLYSFEWYDSYQVDSDFWTWMNKGTLQPEYISTTADGPISITAQAPVTIEPGASFTVYYALALGADEQTMLSNIAAAKLKYESLTTSIKERQSSVNGLKNYPNPVKNATKISYELPQDGFVSIKIYDALGNVAATLVNSKQTSGLHTIDFNAKDLSRGVYSYSLIYNNQVKTSKMVIVK